MGSLFVDIGPLIFSLCLLFQIRIKLSACVIVVPHFQISTQILQPENIIWSKIVFPGYLISRLCHFIATDMNQITEIIIQLCYLKGSSTSKSKLIF